MLFVTHMYWMKLASRRKPEYAVNHVQSLFDINDLQISDKHFVVLLLVSSPVLSDSI